MMPGPLRGEVWRADLEPVRGHEQGRSRPVLVVSNDTVNTGPADLVTIIPITTKAKPLRSFLRVQPPEGGLRQISYIICDQVRTIAKERLDRRFGIVNRQTMGEVELRVRYLLDFR